jgi:hypothetical protein
MLDHLRASGDLDRLTANATAFDAIPLACRPFRTGSIASMAARQQESARATRDGRGRVDQACAVAARHGGFDSGRVEDRLT